MNLRFDILPADDPKDGAVLVSLTAEDQLQEDSGLRVELYGFGSGVVVVNKNHPDVTAANFAPGNFVKVYDESISTEIPIFGFFFEEQFFQVLTVDEQGGQTQRHGGRGMLTVLGRVIWDNTNYVNFGNDAQFGPRIDGRWYWYNDQYGDILKRAIDEAQDSDRPGYATLIPWVTYDFDSTNDSAGNPWVSFAGDHSLPIGENYLDTIQTFIDAGLIIRMDPDFLLQAFQTGGYGVDRTTTEYAPDKVLFTSYFVAADEANIVNRLPRTGRPGLLATRALVKGDSDEPASMRHRTLAGPIGREIFVRVDGTTAPTTLDGAGDQALAAREDASDTPIFRHRSGQNALTGLYTPFPPTEGLPELILPRLYIGSASLGARKTIHSSWQSGAYSGSNRKPLVTTQGAGGGDTNNGSLIPEGNAFANQYQYTLTGTVVFTGGFFRGQAFVKMRHGLGVGWNIGQSQVVVRLFDSSDVLKAVLIGPHEPGALDSKEWINEHDGGANPPYRAAMFPADATWTTPFGAPMASATGVAGDYILIEVGARGFDYSASGWGTDFNNNSSSDIAAGDQTNLNYPAGSGENAWFEFFGAASSTPEWSYWVGDYVTIATGTGVGDYDYEDKRVYAINWVLDSTNTWWPMPELGPVMEDDTSLGGGGGLSAPVGGGGGGGGGGSSSSSSPPPTLRKLFTNESGADVARGDVVVIDPANDESFDTTSTEGETRMVGVALEDILDGEKGEVATHGYVELVTVDASVTRGEYGLTSTTPKEATSSTDRTEGTFCEWLTDGTAPSAWLFGAPDPAIGSSGSGGGGVTVNYHGDVMPTLLRSRKTTADTPDDEFDTALAGTWTVVDGTSGTVSLNAGSGAGVYDLTTRRGWLLAQVGTASGDSVVLRQDYTLPDGKCIVGYFSFAGDSAAAAGSNEQWFGLGVNDNDTSHISGAAGQTAIIMIDTDAGGYRPLGYDGTGVIGQNYGVGSEFDVTQGWFFRIDRVGLTYYLFWSVDGFTWTFIGSKTMATAANNLWWFAECRGTMANRIVVASPWFRQGTALAVDPWPLVFPTAQDSTPPTAIIRKTADESVTSSTTLQDDDQLLMPMLANEVWQVDADIWFEGPAAGDFKYTFTVPSGATIKWSETGLDSAGADHQDGFVEDTSGDTRTQLANGVGVPRHFRAKVLVVCGSTAGNLQFRWAQNTSDGSATKVLTNSTLKCFRLSPAMRQTFPAAGVRVKRVAALNTATSLTAISWDTEVRDDLGAWASSPNPSRLTAQVDGWYNVGTQVSHGNLNSDYLVGGIRLDGTTYITDLQDVYSTDNTPKALNMSTVIYLTAGQYVETLVASSAASALTVGELVAAWMVLLPPPAEPSAGVLLAYDSHTAGDETTTSATLADVDATNAVVTFVAPTSGKVLVKVSGFAAPQQTAGAYISMGLRESTTDIAGAVGESIIARAAAATTVEWRAFAVTFPITGLTPASTHTYKASWATSAGTANLKANASAPLVMEVWSAP